jgi:putative membrane-bound dehydrogenase-like protein
LSWGLFFEDAFMLRFCRFVVVLLLLPLTVHAQNRALPPDQALASMKLPPGFKATLFAAEPAIVQPMAFTFDDRGRLWVVECLSYPTWATDGKGHDRVTILEDTDGDGQHDKRTVFLDNGCNLSGIEIGFGGVWLTAVPNLIFIPDKNGDDKPDGPPQILLDGFDLKARHNVVGNLAWGPDGWLYGCNGILSNSLLGKPGTAEAKRVAINCGVWRYHPVRHEIEAYAHGTTNPWGIDWNEDGEMFITNCVIKHIFHVVPGAHFTRMYGQDINPHSYGLIESCADHQHWAGGHWTNARGGPAHNDAGGGHAHSGCMIYLGDNWPDEYRGNAYIVNIHGQRLNRDLLEKQGSGYVAKHAADFAFWKDPWFRGLHAKYGPDGGVFVSDWSDVGECHDQKEEECDRTTARIFKIMFGDAKRSGPSDLAKLSDKELVELQFHKNQWLVRHSRRLLQERAASGQLSADSTKPLELLLSKIHRLNAPSYSGPERSNSPPSYYSQQLYALWTLHVTRRLDERLVLDAAVAELNTPLRAQAVLLSVEGRQPSEFLLNQLALLALEDPSPVGRLHVASAVQRIPLGQRWLIIARLLGHAEDASDPYLALMYWYAIEPLVPHDVRRAIELLPKVQIPLVRQYLTRRIIAVYDEAGGAGSSAAWVLDALVGLAAKSSDDAVRQDVVNGLCDAFRGRRKVALPGGWAAAYDVLSKSSSPAVQRAACEAAVIFGDQQVTNLLRERFFRLAQPVETQREVLALLAARGDALFARRLISVATLEDHAAVRPEIIRALGGYDLAEIPPALIGWYPMLSPAERGDVIQSLTSRPSFALPLLIAIEQGVIPRTDVSALVIRQLQALNDPVVNARLKQVWGDIRPASAQKKERIALLKTQLDPDVLKTSDLSRGRAIFAKTCASCHKLFDEGSRIGPELTGSQRHNLDYLLDNVLDPSAIVPREYKVNVLRLTDGRVVQGVILEETPHVLTVQTANETVRIPTADIEARKESNLSMMPEGLFDRLSADEVRDLVAYLASPQQAPLPTGSK